MIMNHLNTLHKYASLLLAILLIMSTLAVPVAAEEVDLYTFNRDGNGQPLYLYQSPCMLGYDIDEQNGGNSLTGSQTINAGGGTKIRCLGCDSRCMVSF